MKALEKYVAEQLGDGEAYLAPCEPNAYYALESLLKALEKEQMPPSREFAEALAGALAVYQEGEDYNEFASPKTCSRAIELLRNAAEQFRHYERNHRAKVEKFKARKPITALEKGEIERLIDETISKADVNKEFATEIEAYLAEL